MALPSNEWAYLELFLSRDKYHCVAITDSLMGQSASMLLIVTAHFVKFAGPSSTACLGSISSFYQAAVNGHSLELAVRTKSSRSGWALTGSMIRSGSGARDDGLVG
jgi:hypothetical protein